MGKQFFFRAALATVSLLVASHTVLSQSQSTGWPKSVLITNDNGIEDVKMIQLARAFAKVAKTYVAAPLQNRSGTTHSVSQNRRLTVEAI